jgi:hypothetical protein
MGGGRQVKKGYLLIYDEAEPGLGWRLVWASLRGPLLYYAAGKFADVQVGSGPLPPCRLGPGRSRPRSPLLSQLRLWLAAPDYSGLCVCAQFTPSHDSRDYADYVSPASSSYARHARAPPRAAQRCRVVPQW